MKFSTEVDGNASAYIRNDTFAYCPGTGCVPLMQLEPFGMYQ
jgi:hypothetical protein